MNRELSEFQLACFTLGDKLFAVDIMRIKEIIVSPKLSGLPMDSDILDGVINLRSNVIPVMDLRRRLGMPGRNDGSGKPLKMLIVTLAGQILALMVDDVLEVITVPASEIKPAMQIAAVAGLDLILGVCLSNGRVIMILDIDSLLSLQEMPGSLHT